jgi:glycosyltransferase involved in cell wall biosynthesis
MRRLKILQIFSRYLNPGGEENSVYRIGDALQQQHEVEYFLGSTDELLGSTPLTRVSAPFRAFHNLPVARRLQRYQEVGKFDLWQIHNVLPGLSPSVYQTAFTLGVPIVHYLHNYRMGCINGFFLNQGESCERCLGGNFWPAFQTACWHDSRLVSGLAALITLRIRQIGSFQKVAAWIALSQAQRKKHVEIGLPEERVHVIPHFYEPKGDPLAPCSEGDVLFLGRLSPEKGVDHLLRAWKLISPSSRRLCIAGDGPELPKLRALTSDLGLTNVDFLGFLDRDQQREAWRRTAFSVIPSIWSEPFPLTFLESWTNGRTFVSNRLGAMAEVVKEGKDGLLAEPFAAESLAGQIQRLISAPEACVSMGEAGRGRILNEFNRKLWMDKIGQAYQMALKNSR